jgi:hypothetical protein
VPASSSPTSRDKSSSVLRGRPSDQFGSFASAEVSEVGVELDRKLAALFDHLDVSVPDELRTT